MTIADTEPDAAIARVRIDALAAQYARARLLQADALAATIARARDLQADALDDDIAGVVQEMGQWVSGRIHPVKKT